MQQERMESKYTLPKLSSLEHREGENVGRAAAGVEPIRNRQEVPILVPIVAVFRVEDIARAPVVPTNRQDDVRRLPWADSKGSACGVGCRAGQSVSDPAVLVNVVVELRVLRCVWSGGYRKARRDNGEPH